MINLGALSSIFSSLREMPGYWTIIKIIKE
jgi:hypothetical protein